VHGNGLIIYYVLLSWCLACILLKEGKGIRMLVKTRKLALTEGISAGILFGTGAVLIRFLGNLNAFSIAFWRLTIASIALVMMFLVLRKSFGFKLVRENIRDLLVLGVFLGLHFILFAYAVKDTKILNATVLVNTTPIFSVFVSTFLFNVKPSRLAVVGLTISFVGVCVIAYADAYPFSFSLNLKGDLEAILAAVVEAFYLNFGRKTRSQMPILQTMLPIYLSAASVVGFCGILTNNPITILNEANMVIPLILLGLLPTATAHTLYFSSLSNLKSFETATMALLEPIGATILGVFLFLEVPAPLFVFGALLILLGITFVAKQHS
jgi:drug/metabolite transporter (DMT)-like permease